MTSEIAVMNKNGIALAADSAGTVQTAGSVKIYNSTNKLFALSKYEPVAVMIYGNSEFLGCPWETLIKLFRAHLGRQRLSTIEDYGERFLEFVEDSHRIFPSFQQKEYIKYSFTGFLQNIESDISSKVSSEVEANPIGTRRLNQLIKTNLTHALKALDNQPEIKLGDCEDEHILREYEVVVQECIKKVFQSLPLSKTHTELIRRLFIEWTRRFWATTLLSGIVISGFGESQVFPAIVSYNIEGMILNKIRYVKGKEAQISDSSNALIVPFAQQDMITTFMEGLDPRLGETINSYLERIFTDYPKLLYESISSRLQIEDMMLQEALTKQSDAIFRQIKHDIEEFRRSAFVNGILNAVSVLPKDELAGMAESLINLTSLRRRMSPDAETVGGPVDVAVISKGDGLVWIRRKHYFKPELNHGFFGNYYRQEGDLDG